MNELGDLFKDTGLKLENLLPFTLFWLYQISLLLFRILHIICRLIDLKKYDYRLRSLWYSCAGSEAYLWKVLQHTFRQSEFSIITFKVLRNSIELPE